MAGGPMPYGRSAVLIGSTASNEVLAVSTTTVTVQLPASDNRVPSAV